jgi:hypothetical protein
MGELAVARLGADAFHSGKVPGPEGPPIIVEGLDQAGLEFVDEEIAYALAQEALGRNPEPGEYEEPILGIGLALRGYRRGVGREVGRLELRPGVHEQLSRARIDNGQVEIARTSSGKERELQVTWEADLCFAGVGTVAKSRAATTYDVVRPLDRPWVVTRTLRDRNFTIHHNSGFDSWRVRNGIFIRDPQTAAQA